MCIWNQGRTEKKHQFNSFIRSSSFKSHKTIAPAKYLFKEKNGASWILRDRCAKSLNCYMRFEKFMSIFYCGVQHTKIVTHIVRRWARSRIFFSHIFSLSLSLSFSRCFYLCVVCIRINIVNEQYVICCIVKRVSS